MTGCVGGATQIKCEVTLKIPSNFAFDSTVCSKLCVYVYTYVYVSLALYPSPYISIDLDPYLYLHLYNLSSQWSPAITGLWTPGVTHSLIGGT